MSSFVTPNENSAHNSNVTPLKEGVDEAIPLKEGASESVVQACDSAFQTPGLDNVSLSNKPNGEASAETEEEKAAREARELKDSEELARLLMASTGAQ